VSGSGEERRERPKEGSRTGLGTAVGESAWAEGVWLEGAARTGLRLAAGAFAPAASVKKRIRPDPDNAVSFPQALVLAR
jgi:hypothetical protein